MVGWDLSLDMRLFMDLTMMVSKTFAYSGMGFFKI